MKQILGNALGVAFHMLNVKAVQRHKGTEFEVWELSDAEYKRICDIPEAEWKGNYGWWRWGECILEGSPLYRYSVNGFSMLGYLDTDALADLNSGEDPEDIWDETFYTENKYEGFTDWLSSVMGCSTERNIACFAISLAKANELTLAEFIERYQP